MGEPSCFGTDASFFAVRDADGRLRAPFDLEEAFANYVTEAFAVASGNPRLSPMRLELFYRVKRAIPRSIQLGARRVLAPRQALPSTPAWPIDDGVQAPRALRSDTARPERSELAFRWFWPEQYRAAIILTHDVEGEDGIRLLLELADIEEVGFRSAFNFGGWYRVDEGLLRELRSRGFESASTASPTTARSSPLGQPSRSVSP